MSQVIIFDLPTPGIVVRYLIEPIAPEDLATQAGSYPGTAHLIDTDDLPLACRDAWVWKDGIVDVDLEMARAQRVATLAAEARVLADGLVRVIAAAQADDDDALAARTKSLRKRVQATPDLSEITDPTAIEAFEPPAYAEARAALA